MTTDTELPHQPDTLQQLRKKKNSYMWKAIFIPLLLPLLMINLAPIVVILFGFNNEYRTFAGLALIPSLVVASIADLFVLASYIVTHRPQGKTKIISNVVLILGIFALIIAVVISYTFSGLVPQ
jgi:hypothetical protein